MLGVTAGRGNTLDEVLDYLRRSAAADGTHPKGTIYYCQNGEIRSRVRQGGFPRPSPRWRNSASKRRSSTPSCPRKRRRPRGHGRRRRLRLEGLRQHDPPGAICEHFTSCGGMMHVRGGPDATVRIPSLRRGRRQWHGH